ncbi:MAG: hypothetical protein FE78DRAFT_27537 [Acidomyces sp. 'richmondensis']|nr:MAG: hypothetical protein FE78DRAFT_27537 [Acidomyces sp. 'richmondensis']
MAKAPSPIEVYNDIDRGCVTFYRVLRDPSLFPEFFRRAQLMPYSRAEFDDARDAWDAPDDVIDQALRWFIVARWSFSGRWGAPMSYDLSRPLSRGGSAISQWLSSVDRLPAVHARLQRCLIEQDTWDTILTRYDTPDTLFYCDPPYIVDTRYEGRAEGYVHDFTLADHAALVDRMLQVQGMVVLSGYDHPLYDRLEAAGWDKATHSARVMAHNPRNAGYALRTECLWMNPAAQARRMHQQLDVWAAMPETDA